MNQKKIKICNNKIFTFSLFAYFTIKKKHFFKYKYIQPLSDMHAARE